MASDFQRLKVGRVFDAMDTDGDGRLRAADFEALAERWCALRRAGDGARLRAVMLGWWTALADDAGSPDGVTIEDVLATVDLLPGTPGAVLATADAMFEALDEDSDGRISEGEYNRLIEAWNGRPTDTTEAFGRLDLNADGHLSHDEFAVYWYEFWAGDSPSAPGSHVFGPVTAGH
ncbi:calcium sensor EFh [Actinocorallia longicatena]|uniref:EF-hand domain-containing protein n=1 Tax=Actinocorallia longicatena TaxID=111803 RepID=A0ABP6PYK8_9ACTN